MELTTQEKTALLNQELKGIIASIYSWTISAQVAEEIGNKETTERAQKELEKLVKMKNAYESKIKELEGK